MTCDIDTSTPLNFINCIKKYDTVGDIKRVFTKGYCYGFALMLKQSFKDGEIYWDKWNGHAIFKLDGKYYDINGIYEPMNHSMLRSVNVMIWETPDVL
jgi:hypothetical protein